MKDTITFKGDKELWNKFANNVKLREGNKRMWDVLKPFIEANAELADSKIKRFTEFTLDEYKKNRIIHEIVETREMPRTDGTLFQFPMSGFVDIDFFKEDRISTLNSPIIVGMGSDIARAEKNYLVQTILNSDLATKKIKSLNLSLISKEANSMGSNITVLLPSSLIGQIHERGDHMRIQYNGPTPFLDGHIRFYYVPRDIIQNKIIFIEKSACLWHFLTQQNIVTGKPELIHLEIAHQKKGKKISVLAKTMGKLEILNRKGVKVLEFDKNKV